MPPRGLPEPILVRVPPGEIQYTRTKDTAYGQKTEGQWRSMASAPRRNKEKATLRRNVVMHQMMRYGYLIKEELNELKLALDNKDLLEVADALTDILYVTYGAGHAFGINLDKCFEEIQNSNMSKLDNNGKPIFNESGKVMKGPKYFKPNLSKFIK